MVVLCTMIFSEFSLLVGSIGEDVGGVAHAIPAAELNVLSANR